MARSGFRLTLVVAAAVGVAIGTVSAIVVATRRNNDEAADPLKSEPEVSKPSRGSDTVGPASEAERLNVEGTNAIQRADFQKGRRLFKQAHDLVRNARYAFNEALTYEATESNDEALHWLEVAREECTDKRLMEKIEHRRVIIEKHKGSATR